MFTSFRHIKPYFVLIACLAPSIAPGAGMRGVLFERASLSLNESCRANVLVGTDRFRGTAYLMPKASLSLDASGYPVMEMAGPDASGRYAFRFALQFFPIQSARARLGQSNLAGQACDLHALEDRMNEQARENPDLRGQRITLSPLPVKRIRISIAGITAPAETLGEENTDWLNSLNSGSVELRLGAADARELDRRLKSDLGADLKIDYVFTAQTVERFVRVSLERLDLATELETRLSGAAAPGGVVSEAQISGALTQILSEQKVSISVEGGRSIDDAGISQIVSQLLQNLTAGTLAPANLPASTPPTAEAPRAGAALPELRLQAAARYFREHRQSSLTYREEGAGVDTVYSDSTNFRSDYLSDPNLTFRELVSSDPHPRAVIPSAIRGHAFSLAPIKLIKEELRYVSRVHYLSRSELRAVSADLAPEFRSLSDPSATDRYLLESSYLGRPRAYLVDSSPFRPDTWAGRISPNLATRYILWGSEDQVATVSGEEIQSATPESLSVFPVSAYFGGLGNREFTLEELSHTNEFWTSSVDSSGLVTITPKADLGALFLRNTAQIAHREIVTRRYFQENWSAFKKRPVKVLYAARTARSLPVARVTAIVKVIPSSRTE